MATRTSALLLAFALSALASAGFASDVAQKRTALIVDKSGTVSEVTNLRVEGNNSIIFTQIFESSRIYYEGSVGAGSVVLEVKPFFVGIPFDATTSIEVKGKNCTIKFLRNGQERVISGRLVDIGDLEGKTDFGDFKMPMAKLGKLTFKERPTVSESEQKKSFLPDATLVLTNGERFPVADFRRFNKYCSSEGYILGCGKRYAFLTDFRFSRGYSLKTVEFKDIRTIEFTDVKNLAWAPDELSCPTHCGGLVSNVTVTLRNGKSASGELTWNEEGAGVDGYTGTYENGDFFFYIDLSLVQISSAVLSADGKRKAESLIS